MNLLDQIKLDAKNALIEGKKEKKLVLSTLIGEIQRTKPLVVDNVKTWNDDMCIKTIKKVVDSNNICGTANENVYLVDYLPVMMETAELTKLIETHIEKMGLSGMRDVGKVMGFLKNYTGQYDGKEASTIAKKILL